MCFYIEEGFNSDGVATAPTLEGALAIAQQKAAIYDPCYRWAIWYNGRLIAEVNKNGIKRTAEGRKTCSPLLRLLVWIRRLVWNSFRTKSANDVADLLRKRRTQKPRS